MFVKTGDGHSTTDVATSRSESRLLVPRILDFRQFHVCPANIQHIHSVRDVSFLSRWSDIVVLFVLVLQFKINPLNSGILHNFHADMLYENKMLARVRHCP